MILEAEFEELDQAFEADFGEFHNISDGGFERGYAQGYGEGETAATAAAEAHNAAILTDCNAVLPTKGVQTAETLKQVPHRIGEIKSYEDGYDVGVEDGKQTERERFWEELQLNGKRTNYNHAFYNATLENTGWNDTTFNPIFPIVCKTHGNAGDYLISGTHITTIAVPVEIHGDTSYKSDHVFYNNRKMVTISSLYVDEGCTFVEWFTNDTALENITFADGSVIASNISFVHCPLTNESVQSIIDHLKDLTGQTAQTLTLHATVGGKLTEEQKATITTKNWTLVY